jgi:hypothetical protein
MSFTGITSSDNQVQSKVVFQTFAREFESGYELVQYIQDLIIENQNENI